MKGLLIALVLAVTITALCAAGIGYVNHSTHRIETHLTRCINYANQDDFAKAKTALAATVEAWQQERLILMMYTDQSILDDIDDYLNQMEALADHHPDEFVPTAVLCLNKCKELRQRENISVYSWF